MPKLVAGDIPLLNSLLSNVFPGVQYSPAEMTCLRHEIAKVCQEMYLVYGDVEVTGSSCVEKACHALYSSCCVITYISFSYSFTKLCIYYILPHRMLVLCNIYYQMGYFQSAVDGMPSCRTSIKSHCYLGHYIHLKSNIFCKWSFTRLTQSCKACGLLLSGFVI